MEAEHQQYLCILVVHQTSSLDLIQFSINFCSFHKNSPVLLQLKYVLSKQLS